MPALRDLFLRPGVFFHELGEAPPDYKMPFAIVIAAGVLHALLAYLLFSWMAGLVLQQYTASVGASALPSSFMAALAGVGVTFATIFGFFGPVITWVAAGIVFWLIAWLWTRKGGSLTRTLAATGWGMIPFAAYEAAAVALFFAFKDQISVTIPPGLFATGANATARNEFSKAFVYNHAYLTYAGISTALLAAALLCCAWFWIPAVRETCGLDTKKAAVAVLLPVILYLAYICLLPLLMGQPAGMI